MGPIVYRAYSERDLLPEGLLHVLRRSPLGTIPGPSMRLRS